MVLKQGPKSFQPAELIMGGQLVEARAASRIGVAAAGSAKVIGVALVDGVNPEAISGSPTIVGGRSVLNAALLPTTVAVAYGGMEVPVTYSAAAAFGDALVATANGQVGPAGATPDARTIVGRCSAPAGVAAGAVGLMRTA
jgi:hypothetical protein